MVQESREATKIQQSDGVWRQAASLPVVLDLLNLGVTKTRVAQIFNVNPRTIHRLLKAHAKNENAPASTKGPGRDQTQENARVSPQQDTSGETTTTNGGTQ